MKRGEDIIRQYQLGESIKRLQMLSEYSFITKPNLDEAEPTDDQQQGGGGNPAPVDSSNQGGQQPQGGAPAGGGEGPAQMGNPDVDGGTAPEQPLPGNDNGGGASGLDGGNAEGGPDDDDTIEDIEMDQDDPEESGDGEGEDGGAGPDDEVIEIDDLTNAQEAAEAKIDGVDEKLTTLIAVVNKFKTAIDQSNAKILQLQKDFDERNPSEQEKLNLRSQAGYPFSEQPKDYWTKKTQQDPRYNVMFNNDVPTNKEQEEFVLRKSDLRGTNPKTMERSFDYSPSLDDYLGF